MSNLGTLSFDVDLDLSKLQTKINQQNEAVKQALEGLQVKVATKSVGELAQQIQSELNNHQFAIKLDEAKLSGLKSDIVSIADKSKEIADNFARMGQGGGGTQQAVNIDLSKFNGISEIIGEIEKEMKRLYNVFADTTDGSGKKVAGLITNLSLLKDALEQLGNAAKNFTPTQQLNEAATAAQNVATATQNAAKATKTASDEEAEATKKANIERERQLKLIAEVQTMLSKIGGISSENTGLNPQRINEVKQAYEGMLNSLSTIPTSKSLQELSAELATLKANTKGFFQEVSQSQKAVESIRLVRYALKQVNEQMASGNTSPKLEGFREQLQAINREMHNLMKAGNLDGIQNLFAGHKGMSDGVVSIIRQMVTEMKKLGVATQETAGITSHLSAEEQKLAQSIQQSTNSMRGQSQILSDLKTMAMQYLSVWGAQSFIHNIIQTGGLLEQQRMSIGAILGDLSQANHLFGQIQQLALKSPFGVVQLDTMSKQLTAYNFKYSELYDWTKRLADISAATGTEVSRLSLALGHVRSEGALSGYTLRQFAMGNVPLLQTLAQQLGKTTSEIRKMTREKAITYDDVEKALRTLTDEGGIFFNAQEVMSEALNAKFKNMHDAFDIMFGQMAESGVGDILKRFAETLTVMVKNWEQVGAVILSVAGTFGVYKAAQLVSNKVMMEGNVLAGRMSAAQLEMQATSGKLTQQLLLQAVATGKVTVAQAQAAATTLGLTHAQLQHVANTGKVAAAYNMASLATSKYTVQQLRLMATFRAGSWTSWTTWLNGARIGLMGLGNAARVAGLALKGIFLNPATWWMVGITAGVELLMHFKQKSDEAKQSIADMTQTANEGFKNLADAFSQYAKADGSSLDASALSENIKGIVEAIKNYHPRANDILEEANACATLAEKYEFLRKELESLRNSYADLSKHSNVAVDANDSTGNFFVAKFSDNIEDWLDALKDAQKEEQEFARHRIAIAKALDSINNTAFQNSRYNVADDGTKTLKPLTEQLRLVRENEAALKQFSSVLYTVSVDAGSAWQRVTKGFTEADRQLESYVTPSLESYAKYIDDIFAKDYGDDWKKNKDHVNEALKLITEWLSKVDGMTDTARQNLLKKIFNDNWRIGFKFNLEGVEEELTGWQKEMQDWFEANHIDVRLSMDSTRDDIAKQVFAQKDKMQKIADSAGKVLIGVGLKLDKLPEQLASPLATPWNTEALSDYKTNTAGVKALEDFIKQWNLTSEKASKKAETAAKKAESAAEKARKKEIENIKTQIEEIKKFYAEYQKYRDVYGNEEGQRLVEKLFGIDHAEADKIINDYKGMLENLAQQLEANGDKKGALSVRQLIGELNLADAKEIAESTLNKLGKELEAQSKRWDLYKKILDATGNKEQASTIAFGKLINFDNFGQELRDQITKALDSVPKAKGKSIDELLKMDDNQLKKLDIFKDSTNNIYNLLKKLADVEQSLNAEEVDLFLDALNNAKSLETELAQIENKYKKTQDAINNNSSLSQEDKYSLLSNANANKAKEIADTQWKYFKQTEDWGRIFGNLDKVTTATLTGMRDNLIAMLPSVKDSVEATKALYEALDKIDKAVSNRNPFKAISEGLGKASTIKKLMKQRANGDVVGTELGKLLGVNPNTVVDDKVRKQANDAVKAAEDDFATGLKGVAEKFADVQAVLQPVINLFDQLGEKGLSQMFQMGGDALGAASNAASAMSSLGLESAGPYAAAAAAGLSIVSSLFAMHDAALQEEIDASKERVKIIENLSKGLEKAFERTLNAIQNAQMSEREEETFKQYLFKYDIADSYSGTLGAGFKRMFGYIQDDTIDAINKALGSGSYYDTKLAELLIQRDEISKQLTAEKSKKDSDAGAIADYEAQLEDMKDQIENFALDMAKALYDIDIKSWASELTDAVVEAWENGEDAVDAYKKKVKDMMKDLLKTILAQRIMEQAFENAGITDLIKNLMTGSAGNIDENAVIELANALGEAGEAGVNAITVILDKMEELGYISKAEAEETVANIDTIKSAFEDLLSDPTQDIEEWGKNFRNSLIQELVKNMLLGEEFEKWAADWNERVTNLWNAYNNNEISKDAFDEGMAELYQEFDNMANGMTERGQQLFTDLGYVFDEAESEGLFDGLSDSWVSTLMDMSKSADDWAKEVGQMIAEQIIKQMVVPTMIQPLIDNLQDVFQKAMDAATTTDENGKKSYDWDAVLNNEGLMAALNALSEKYPEIQSVIKHIMEALGLDTSNYKYDGFSNLADSIIDSLKSADGSLESWAAEQGKKMAEQMAKAYADTEYGDRIKQLNEEWQKALEANDVKRMEELRAELEKLYAEMGKDEKLKGLIEDFKELSTTVTNLSDSFVSSLMDMSKTAEDWAQDLGKTIAEAIIKATVVPTLIQPLLQNVQDVFDSVIESATSLDADGKKVVDWKTVINDEGLMSAIQNVVDQYPELQSVIEKIMSAFGLKLHDNPFADMASTFTSSLMDMEQSAEDFANNIAKSLTQEMITKVIKDQYQGEIDALGEQWKQALEQGDSAAIERIRQQLEVLYGQMGDAVKPLLDAISDIGKETDKTFSSMTDSWVSALMDMEGTAEDFAQTVGKTMAQKIITELIAPTYIQPILDAMQKAYNLAIAVPGATISSVLAQMTPFIGQIEDVYRQIQPMIEEIFGTIGIVADSVEEAAEEVEYALSDMKSNFVSALMDMSNTAEDFSRDISKILAQSFIEKFVLGNQFDAQMKYWQEQYESIIGSGMSEDERKRQLKALRDTIVAAKEGYINEAMAIQELFGLTTEDNQTATMNMADKITYDQADQLLGIGLAQLLTQEQMLSILKGDASLSTPMFDSLVGDTASNDENSQMIAATMQSLLDVTRNNTDNILAQVAISNNHLYAISEYTKSIKGMLDEHLVSMDNKLTNLSRL